MNKTTLADAGRRAATSKVNRRGLGHWCDQDWCGQAGVARTGVDGTGLAPGHVYVGCSGWSYKHWRGTVYDPALKTTQWFEAYAHRFSTVEVNNTFYGLPAATTFTSWRAQAPAGFVFALKLNQFGTHRMKLRDPAGWLPTYVERALLLGTALGPTSCSCLRGGNAMLPASNSSWSLLLRGALGPAAMGGRVPRPVVAPSRNLRTAQAVRRRPLRS